MKNKLPCYLVRDLLPMYADELLSPESEKDIRDHLDECKECSSLYKQMTHPEPEITEDVPEVDYLKKVNKGRKRLLACAAVLVALIAAGAFINSRIQAAKADITYDEATKTMVIYGKDDTDLKLPKTVNEATELDAQFDNFHLKIHLPILRTGEEDLASYLPGYLGRTNESIKFIRNYLNDNCPDIDLADRVNKYVDLSIQNENGYTWSETEDRIELEIGGYYWHREEMYILALLGSRSVQWKQLAYAWYLGACIDPYCEDAMAPWSNGLEELPYYEAYARGGGTDQNTPENYKIMFDAASYLCLTNGMHWGSAYESYPLLKTALYSGPAKMTEPGNEMSVFMATSFIAYLSDKYGFDTVSEFCFNDMQFEEAFGTDWQTEYDAWAEWILATYGN